MKTLPKAMSKDELIAAVSAKRGSIRVVSWLSFSFKGKRGEEVTVVKTKKVLLNCNYSNLAAVKAAKAADAEKAGVYKKGSYIHDPKHRFLVKNAKDGSDEFLQVLVSDKLRSPKVFTTYWVDGEEVSDPATVEAIKATVEAIKKKRRPTDAPSNVFVLRIGKILSVK